MANILQVNRNNEDPESILACESNKEKPKNNNNKNNNDNDSKAFKTINNDIFDKLHSQDHKFSNLFSKHIKKKKRYEIREIAQVRYYLFL